MTGSASGFSSPSRRLKRGCRHIADGSGAAQNLGAVAPGHADRADRLARLRLFDIGLYLLALEGGVAVMRRQASGLEPGLAPDPLAQRRELAEMGRALDGAALKAQLLRGCIVVDRGVGVVDLRVKHLLRAPPRPDEQIAAFQYLGRERRFRHPWCLPLRANRFKEGGVRQEAGADPQDGRDMPCGREIPLGTHSKTGAFWSQLDRFK